MRVYVRLGEPLWRAVGERRLVLEWPDRSEVPVDEVLDRLRSAYPDFAAAYAGAGLGHAQPYRLFVDHGHPAGRPGEAEEAAPSIRDGQTLFILLPAVGGCAPDGGRPPFSGGRWPGGARVPARPGWPA